MSLLANANLLAHRFVKIGTNGKVATADTGGDILGVMSSAVLSNKVVEPALHSQGFQKVTAEVNLTAGDKLQVGATGKAKVLLPGAQQVAICIKDALADAVVDIFISQAPAKPAIPEVPATPDAQDVVDALIARGEITQAT